MMRKFTNLAIAIGAGLCFGTIAQADDLRFTALPQTVQTTVIRETRIPDASGVTRIVRDSSGIYVVTVRGATGEQVVYVNEAGLIVAAPLTTTTVQRVEPVQPAVTTTTVQKVEPVQPAVASSQTVVTYGEVQKDTPRYELLTKKGDKEVYRDRQTGQKVTVKRQNN
jgi:hypothetical protein